MQKDLLKEASPWKKALRPSIARQGQRREMAVEAVANRHVSIALACRTFQISECCYRYERKLNDENAEIAEWLVKRANNRRTWGFGWNHERAIPTGLTVIWS